MIAFLAGKLRMAGVNHVVVEAGGVGYRVSVPLSLMAQMPAIGLPVELYIHTQVREDAIQLFGFPTLEDQELFELLITITGVGPKVALGMMSVLASGAIANAISSGDSAALQRVPGVGAKTAQRIVLELKDKMTERMWLSQAADASGPGEAKSEALKDAVEALVALGYPRAQARQAAEKAADDAALRDDVAALVRSALRILTTR